MEQENARKVPWGILEALAVFIISLLLFISDLK
jgi:hypothetical protein